MIKAIETEYNGYRFRSRLEARWAVFFDTLGIKYEYEKEGYDLDGTLYLPDFWLPQQKFWVEIKGDNQIGFNKVASLSEHVHNVFLIPGTIPNINADSDFDDFPQIVPFEGGCPYDSEHVWCECPDCGFVGIEWNGCSDRLACKQCIPCFVIEHRKVHDKYKHDCFQCQQAQGEWSDDTCPYHPQLPHQGCPRNSLKLSKCPNYDSPRLIAAYKAARSARFEHGEKG